MNAFQKKITLRVLGIHAAIIFLVAIVPLMRGCFTPKPKEIVTFIEFGAPAEPVSAQPVAHMPDPEPPPPPAPTLEPDPIPEPVKKKPEPIKKKPEPVKKKPEPVKPKWKPVDPKDIKKGKKVNETPKTPAVSNKDIQKALSGITSSAPAANPSQFNDYYARVMRLFYNHWKPPASASSATGSTVVRISMRKNGQITKRAKIKGSGDSLYDKTAMDAVNAVGTMPRPPSNYPYDYVEVVFTLDN